MLGTRYWCRKISQVQEGMRNKGAGRKITNRQVTEVQRHTGGIKNDENLTHGGR